MSVYKKIQACRASIKASNLKKSGRNTYSKYDYYTPEQVDKLVYDACLSEGLFNKFELKRDSNGLYGEMSVIDTDKGEVQTFILATEMPEITATNATQQMGGCMTYCNRYLLMNIYDIVENALDPDAQKPQTDIPRKTPAPSKDEKKWLNEGSEEFRVAKKSIEDGTRTIAGVRKFYQVSKKIEALLIEGVEMPTPPAEDGPDF